MQTAEYNPNDFTTQGQSEADKGLLVRFFWKPKLDAAASAEAGRPVHKDVEYVDIKVPGDRSGGAVRPARQSDINRFPEHYKAFKERTGDVEVEGTLLSEWPACTRSQVEDLAYANVRTVEQLAAMSDAHNGQFMGINNLKRKAQEWLEVAEKQKAGIQLKVELEKRDALITEQAAMLKELQEQMAELTAPKKRGRPKKEKTEEE